MNSYCALGPLKRRLNVGGTNHDGELLSCLQAASRELDGVCRRVFYIRAEARVFDVLDAHSVCIDDCLEVGTLATDAGGTGAYTAWDSEDFQLEPRNTWPKTRVWSARASFPCGPGRLRIEGVWGFGDGEGPDPWEGLAVTATASASAETLSLSTAGKVDAGDTLLIDDEQVYVTAATGTTATVRRGVNGTAPSEHTSAAVGRARYPDDLRRATLFLAAALWNRESMAGFGELELGDWRARAERVDHAYKRRLVGRLIR